MGLFAYQVIDKSGGLTAGQLEADSEWVAAERLRKMGLTVVDLSELRSSSTRRLFKMRRKVGIGELSLFTRQLASMLDAGIPLTRALYTLSRQASKPSLGAAVEETARAVEGGMSFSDALRAHPDIFSSLYVGMIKAGEVGGSLVEMLRRLSEQLERDKSLRDNIRAATFYPVLILCFATLVVLGMMFFIVPLFVNFFPAGLKLPLPTKIIITISNSLRHFWYVWLLCIAAVVFGVRCYISSPVGQRVWDRLKFRIPAFGPVFHRATTARFLRTLATLLGGGIPVLQALEASGAAAGNTIVTEAAAAAAEKIQEGKSIAGPLEESGFFPPMVIQMVAIGEESGALPFLLTKMAGFYEEEVAAMTRGLAAVIEPLMIIFVGCIVAVIVLSLYLPIFLVVTTVGT